LRHLRKCGYYDPGPRDKLFRLTGDVAESDEEVLEMLKKLGSRHTQP